MLLHKIIQSLIQMHFDTFKIETTYGTYNSLHESIRIKQLISNATLLIKPDRLNTTKHIKTISNQFLNYMN